MKHSWNELPLSSRVWIYQADSIFSDHLPLISKELEAFMKNWKAHGQHLDAAYTIRYDQFIIIAVNEQAQMATGCAIDASVKLLQDLGSKTNIDFFNRTKILYKNDSEEIGETTMLEFSNDYSSGLITESTVVFNNLAATIEEVQSNWEVPVSKSWQSRLVGATD